MYRVWDYHVSVTQFNSASALQPLINFLLQCHGNKDVRWILLQREREVGVRSRWVCDLVQGDCFLTVFIQEQLVESQTTGLFANEAVHVLGAVVVNSDGVFQRFDTRLQTERNLGVANSVPEKRSVCTVLFVL